MFSIHYTITQLLQCQYQNNKLIIKLVQNYTKNIIQNIFFYDFLTFVDEHFFLNVSASKLFALK